ncbi:MAG: cysteine desulfurase family protein subfamily [Gammaproteobacteria bacterium]|nr:cysteine desulfurase family protein subfamily [Gammaproteobacteria bacterium]
MPFTAEHGERCRKDFPALQCAPGGRDRVFLDGPGGSQVPDAVIRAMTDFYRSCNVNTHGNFPPSREVDRRMAVARETLAAFLGAAGPECISFGQNMTTLNFALSAAIGRTLEAGDEILITQLDHEANRGPWLRLQERGAVIREVKLTASGELDAADMAAKITTRTRVFAIGASSNALGTVNDIALARRLTSPVGALLVVDAVHYAPHFPVDVRAMDADFLLCSGYKFYGPHVGVLYSKPGALDRLPTDRLSVQDPAAPYRIETGTLNHAAIDGMRAAVDYLASWGTGTTLRERIVDAMSSISAYEHGLAKSYHAEVSRLPGVRVWGPGFLTAARAPTVSITLERHTAAEAAGALGERGVCVWDGNFYAARAVEVLGLAERGGLLRTGISMYSTESDLRRLLDGLGTLTRKT